MLLQKVERGDGGRVQRRKGWRERRRREEEKVDQKKKNATRSESNCDPRSEELAAMQM